MTLEKLRGTQALRLVALLALHVITVGGFLSTRAMPAAALPISGEPAGQSAPSRALGTIKSIDGKNLTIVADSGAELNVVIQENARLLRVEPGEKDLKTAAPLALSELQVGDRVLVRGNLADDKKTLLAHSVVAIKKADLAAKRAKEQEEWQRNGAGGLVKSVDAAAGTILIATNAFGAARDVTIHTTTETVLRRYASDSTKFDDARPAPLADVHPGDQLRARGVRSADGSRMAAVEVVSGTFLNLAGIISTVGPGAHTLTLQDLAAGKSVTVTVTAESQIRKLPPPVAQQLAMRLKGTGPDAAGSSGGEQGRLAAPPSESNARREMAGAGPNRASGGGARPELQQFLSRLPAVQLSDLQKGDAVMIVATGGARDGVITAINILAGVEPILEASPKD
jgi:hypothetical protein